MAVERCLVGRGEGRAALQAHAVQTLARLPTTHPEPGVFILPGFRDELKEAGPKAKSLELQGQHSRDRGSNFRMAVRERDAQLRQSRLRCPQLG